MIKKYWKLIIVVSLIVIIGSIFVFLSRDKENIETFSLVKQPYVQQINATGRIIPAQEINVQSSVSGAITQILVEEQMQVNAGDILIIIDDTDAKNTLSTASSNLDIVKLNLLELAQNQRISAKTVRDQTLISYNEAKALLDDYQVLFKEDAIDRASVDQATSDLARKNAQLQSAQSAYESLLQGGATLQAMQASVTLAENNVTSAQNMLEKHIIRAPIDGFVSDIFYQTGELIQPFANLVNIITDDNFLVTLQIDERNISLINMGQKASIWPEGLPSQKADSIIKSIAAKVEEKTGTVEVLLEILEDKPYLLQDLTVQAEILVREASDALLIPANYLYKSNPNLVLITKDGKIEAVEVQLEPISIDQYLVLEGLSEGDEIVRPSEDIRVDLP